MCCSFIMGLPGVGLIGVLSFHWHEPLLIIIGGPLLIVLAHLVFFVGMYLAGGNYFMVFFDGQPELLLKNSCENSVFSSF